MARDFSKNTSNYMSLGVGTLGSLINGASAVSAHVWANIDSTDSGVNDNSIFNVIGSSALTRLTFRIDGSGATKYLRVGGRSQNADGFQARNATSSFSIETWHSCGGVWDFDNDTITPYFNGAAENGGSVTFGSSTYSDGSPTTPDYIGAFGSSPPPSSSAEQTDGRLAEFALWNADIGADGFADLAEGRSALSVCPHLLVVYFRLLGTTSPERDIISGASGTITGTIAKADHPRIIQPTKRRVIRVETASAGIAGPLIGGRLTRSVLTNGRLVG